MRGDRSTRTVAAEVSGELLKQDVGVVVGVGVKLGHLVEVRAKAVVVRDDELLGKRIGAVISEARNPSEYPEDLMNLMKKAVALIEHVGSNPKDLHNKRSLGLTESKIRRLARYYIDEGRLPQEWRYRREEVRLMVN